MRDLFLEKLPDVFHHFTRKDWAYFGNQGTLQLSKQELVSLSGLGEPISLDAVSEVYVSLCRLINLHIQARKNILHASQFFMPKHHAKIPFVIGIAGSVAVGKSTIARVLKTLLSRGESKPKVSLIPTDGFLLPNAELKKLNLMECKGFPESYRLRSLLNFLATIKAGKPSQAPVYSHLLYDIIPKQFNKIVQPDILIVEGLNLLQIPPQKNPSVSDFIDFSIYVHAQPRLIETWYCQRFLKLLSTTFQDPSSYFHEYVQLSQKKAFQEGKRIWKNINLVNLIENIHPTMQRANLILEKRQQHVISHIHLRKL